MEQDRVEDLKNRVLGMWRENEALRREARDLPVLWRNAERVKASLAMMLIGLGLEPDSPE